MRFLENLDKKYKYVIHSALITVYSVLASLIFWNYSFFIRLGIGIILVAVLALFVHYPNVGLSKKKITGLLMVLILPFSLFISILLALKYYPNLSIPFKGLMLIGTGFLLYLISIVDNIFLVNSQREETIPLYRAAVPWSQILTVVVAIPLFAGIFKIPTYSIIQVGIIALISFIFGIYQIWAHRYEDNLVPVGQGGTVLLITLISFFVFSIGIATSFMSTESFLRGLNTAAALMFGLFYTSSFLKNTLNKKILIQYFFILLIFILLSIIFA